MEFNVPISFAGVNKGKEQKEKVVGSKFQGKVGARETGSRSSSSSDNKARTLHTTSITVTMPMLLKVSEN